MKKLFVSVFILYLVILVQLVIFKGWLFYHIVHSNTTYRMKSATETYRDFNLIPFRTMRNFLNSGRATSTSIKVFNLLGNIALFIPFGFLLPQVYKKAARFKYVVLASLGLSFSFELYQFLTHTGDADVDDIILNTLGGMLGYLALIVCIKWFKPAAGLTQ